MLVGDSSVLLSVGKNQCNSSTVTLVILNFNFPELYPISPFSIAIRKYLRLNNL